MWYFNNWESFPKRGLHFCVPHLTQKNHCILFMWTKLHVFHLLLCRNALIPSHVQPDASYQLSADLLSWLRLISDQLIWYSDIVFLACCHNMHSQCHRGNKTHSLWCCPCPDATACIGWFRETQIQRLFCFMTVKSSSNNPDDGPICCNI